MKLSSECFRAHRIAVYCLNLTRNLNLNLFRYPPSKSERMIKIQIRITIKSGAPAVAFHPVVVR
jgi:hypothetical protein